MKIRRRIEFIVRHFSSVTDLTRLHHIIPTRRVATRRDRCVGCGACARRLVCPVKAVSITNQKVSIDHSRCLGCGHCVLACRRGALALKFG